MPFVLWFMFWYMDFSGLGNTVRSKNVLDLVLHILHLIQMADLECQPLMTDPSFPYVA